MTTTPIMTTTPVARPGLVADELVGLVTMLSARFPDRASDDIGRLVTAVYGDLAADARIPTHLIPLTLNKCRRLLSESSAA
jgi:hypothetical protein